MGPVKRTSSASRARTARSQRQEPGTPAGDAFPSRRSNRRLWHRPRHLEQLAAGPAAAACVVEHCGLKPSARVRDAPSSARPHRLRAARVEAACDTLRRIRRPTRAQLRGTVHALRRNRLAPRLSLLGSRVRHLGSASGTHARVRRHRPGQDRVVHPNHQRAVGRCDGAPRIHPRRRVRAPAATRRAPTAPTSRLPHVIRELEQKGVEALSSS
jgi:hypothetical protein